MKELSVIFSVIFNFLFNSLSVPSDPAPFQSTLLPAYVIEAKEAKKWGYIDSKGTFVIQPKYDIAGDFNPSGKAFAADILPEKSGYDACSVSLINHTGEQILGPIQSNKIDLPKFVDGMAFIVDKSGTSKVINEEGSILFESNHQILSYSDGMFRFHTTGKPTLYGYLNDKGKDVIPAKFSYAEDFINGYAKVEPKSGQYVVIDKKGKVIHSGEVNPKLPDAQVGLITFFDDKLDLYGYKTFDGKVIVKPKFKDVEEFKEGYAVVTCPKGEYETSKALIDGTGNYVIKPDYSGIHSLGQGLYAVSKNALSPYNDYGVPKAIFNNKGQQLTPFKYYDMEEFRGEFASACDDTSTFFINKKGEVIDGLPRLRGIGTIEFKNDVIKAEVDGLLYYLTKDGKVIWKGTDYIHMDGGFIVDRVKFRPDYCTLVEYPQLKKLADELLQDKINKQLKTLFLTGHESSPSWEDSDNAYSNTVDVGFEAEQNKDLLIIYYSSYDYPIGAAHGMPSKHEYHIDLKSGRFYELKDLFKLSSKYDEVLTEMVRKQMELNARVYKEDSLYFDSKPVVGAQHSFTITKESLQIYFTPYEIAPYAAGFPTFDIPYGQILNIIDTQGELWKSFDKDVKNNVINNLGSIESDTVKSIEQLIGSYEVKLIEAVNTNDFNKVKPYLFPGSPLYQSQKQLVTDLNKQGIKEKLISYQIYAVTENYSEKNYKVFTMEKAGIKNPGKDYVTKDYMWSYTVKLDSSDGKLKLSNIEKW